MFNENEDLVLNDTENVEAATEEPVEQEEKPAKSYTDEEFKQIVGKKLARREAKITKQFERKYGELEKVLKAGTGLETVEEMTEAFKNYYQGRNVEIPSEPAISDKDMEVLAKAEAEDIISGGYEEVVEEVERLKGIGLDKMNQRDKALFRALANYRNNAERGKELAKIGVTEDVYNGQEFKEFAAKFSSSTPVREIYEIYMKAKPQKEVFIPGSMKHETSDDGTIKEYYTREEALKFTKEDFDKNPQLFKAVEKSMLKW